MKKSVSSLITVNRAAVLLSGLVLSLAVFGIAAWHSRTPGAESIGNADSPVALTAVTGNFSKNEFATGRTDEITSRSNAPADIDIFNVIIGPKSTRNLFTVTDIQDRETVLQWESDNPADELEAALEFEFNMTQDPATGKIPEGIHDAEVAQANELVEMQRSVNRPELGTYSFVGPDNLGGRTRAIVYDKRFDGVGNQIILAGGISNGIFKSTDNGAT